MNEQQFAILMEKLEEIRCCIIDVETAVDELTTLTPPYYKKQGVSKDDE